MREDRWMFQLPALVIWDLSLALAGNGDKDRHT